MKESEEELEDDLNKMLENCAEKKSLYATTLIAFQNIGVTLSNSYLLQKLMPWCLEGLKSSSWQAQHVSLIVIGLLIEGTKKHIVNDLDQLLNLSVPFLNSSNPKVVYSCLTCLGLLIQEFSPEIQTRKGESILASLIQIIN